METNTVPQRPKWMTDDTLAELREDIRKCSDPYTDDEMKECQFMDEVDELRFNAKTAIDILTHFGIPFEE